jgi:hypothetical protein
MSKEEIQPEGGVDLGQSTPLVTIPPPTIPRTIIGAVPAGDDHPLASFPAADAADVPTADVPSGGVTVELTAALPPLPPPPPPPPSSSIVPTIISPPPPVPQFTTFQPPPPPTSSSSPSIPAATTPQKAAVKITSSDVSPSRSLDSLADMLLSGPSYRTDTLGLPPVLRPLPLPSLDMGVQRLRTLVERRAWGDVLKVATTMLSSSGGGGKDENPHPQHSDVYASLLMVPFHAQKIDSASFSDDICQETVEILALQCHAFLKLRRYNDLATEVERWNFVTHNDATAESPEWLPWSLRKFYRAVLVVVPVLVGDALFCC